MSALPLPSLPKIKDILRIYGLKATKRLSQNFILDLRLTEKLARTIKTPKGCTIIEVGSGPGSLTRALLDLGAKQVIAIEKDDRFIQTLRGMQQYYGEDRLKIVHGDALEIDEQKLINDIQPLSWERQELPKVRIAGNLPFNIATPLISKWMDQIESKSGAFAYGRVPLYLMFQKEVAERIVAPHNTPEFGRISLLVQNLCEPSIVSIVNGKSFVPPAQVDAGFVEIIPRRKQFYEGPAVELQSVAKTLLNTRRKALKTTLKHFTPDYHCLLDELQVSENTRPTELSIEQWCRLAKLCSEKGYLRKEHEKRARKLEDEAESDDEK